MVYKILFLFLLYKIHYSGQRYKFFVDFITFIVNFLLVVLYINSYAHNI